MAMTVVSKLEDFAVHKTAVTALVLETVNLYLRRHGHPGLHVGALHQMTLPLSAAMGEMLMFGADLWPDSAKED